MALSQENIKIVAAFLDLPANQHGHFRHIPIHLDRIDLLVLYSKMAHIILIFSKVYKLNILVADIFSHLC